MHFFCGVFEHTVELWDSALCLQARLEVHRFGITGYGKGKERVLEQERAIMLGAKVRGSSACHHQTGYRKRAREPRASQGKGHGKFLQNKK